MENPKHLFDPAQYDKRVGEVFPSAILTLISIIQGVALSCLIDKTFALINQKTAVVLLDFVPYAFLSLTNLVLVAFEYVWFVGLFTGIVSVVDIIFIFALGITEVAPMYYLTSPYHWWTWNMAFCLIGAGAFTNNSLYKAGNIRYKSEKVEHVLRLTLKRNRRLSLIAFGVSAISSWALHRNECIEYIIPAALCMMIFLLLTFFVMDNGFLCEVRRHCVFEISNQFNGETNTPELDVDGLQPSSAATGEDQ